MGMAEETLELELDRRFVQDFFDLWINPEIERRREVGQLSNSFVLYAAQVIMDYGAPTVVRLTKPLCTFSAEV